MTTRPEDVEAAIEYLQRLWSDGMEPPGSVEHSVCVLLASHAALVEAAQAVVDRWDSPNWSDAEHTGVLIGRLRELLLAKSASYSTGPQPQQEA